MIRTVAVADSVAREQADGDPAQLVPHTLLSALHRRRSDTSVLLMDRLPELESQFLLDVRGLRGGTLTTLVDALPTRVRAWPVCLRRVAVEHVRCLVQGLHLLP